MRIIHQNRSNRSRRIDKMMKKTLLTALFALGLGMGGATTAALASGGEQHIEDFDFSFEGPFGKYDPIQLQRGLKVYTEVCSACHGLRHVAFRTLSDEGGPGFTPEQVKAYAAGFDIYNAELDEDLPGKPSDKFPLSSLSNAPDLSLMAKARAGFHGPNGLGINQFVKGMGGTEYIASILTGFTGEEKEQAGTTFYENTAFPGGWIAMAPPLQDEQVEFDDGHKNDVEHMAEDVSAFLMWAAEPKMMARKRLGLTSVLFLGLFTVLLYLTNKKIWAPIKRKEA
jgi:ubiquinol-cytochrome c reductase cytochrome c1 subunit